LGVAHNGLTVEDVLAVTQDFGLWAICISGVFRADLRGVFKKKIEVDDLIPYSRIEDVRVEPSGPRAGKLVMLDVDDRQLGQVDFRAGGPDGTVEEERAQCGRIVRMMEGAWRQAQ